MNEAVERSIYEPIEPARESVEVISDMKGENIVLIDLRELTDIADYFVICTANSDRHLKAIKDKIEEKLREEFDVKPARVEGKSEGGWILMDYLDFVIHLFTEERRHYYNLEEFWKEAKVVLRMQ